MTVRLKSHARASGFTVVHPILDLFPGRFPRVGCDLRPIRVLEWQFQGERGALARSIAVGRQSPLHFFRRERRAVKSKAMAVLSRGEAVGKNARQVLGRNADTVIRDLDGDPVIAAPADPDGDFLVGPGGFVAGVLGVVQDVDEDLEHLVFVHD